MRLTADDYVHLSVIGCYLTSLVSAGSVFCTPLRYQTLNETLVHLNELNPTTTVNFVTASQSPPNHCV